MERIEARPTDGLSYSPAEPRYWERPGLEKELNRVFDICHGCRLCFNLCPSFAELFEGIDAQGGEVRSLAAGLKRRVVELCYGCKLCEVKCPYSPKEGHEFQLDFPRLMLRARAVEARAKGLALRERMLGDPDRLGRMGARSAALANWAGNFAPARLALERLVGIDRRKKLPEFARESFVGYLKRVGPPSAPEKPAARVALFHTCFVNYYRPEVGRAALAVLEKNRCAVACPEQNCCGMPALDGGNVELARKLAQANLATLLPLVRQGFRVAALNPTCALMMRREYPLLLGSEPARQLAGAVADTHEVLYELRRAGSFERGFRSTPVSIAYHVPCHLKAQAIGFRARDLMRLIPGVQIVSAEACTCHDGTWAMKKEFFALSMKWGEKAFAAMTQAQARVMVSDCPLAALQIEQATGVRPLHPLEVLARAYESDGFADPVGEQPGG